MNTLAVALFAPSTARAASGLQGGAVLAVRQRPPAQLDLVQRR